MSLPTYVTVPSERTITLLSSVPESPAKAAAGITQHPVFLPSVSR